MKILALESSAKAASCAIMENGVLLASSYQATGLTHSRTLMPMVEAMLQNSELSLDAMDAFAVSIGPGSFTGLRIGIAALKGLAFAMDKPCIGVSTLEAMAAPLAHLDTTIICAMDARRQQIYNSIFLSESGTLTRLAPDRAISLAELEYELDPAIPYIVVGDGGRLCFAYLTEHGIPCEIAPPHLLQQSAVGVCMVAERLIKEGKTVSAQELTPNYLRLSQAERERLAKLQQEASL